MSERFYIPLIIVTLVALCFVGACNPTCSIRPALINWERREKPIFPLRPKKQHAAPGGLPTEGEAESLHSGAAPKRVASAAHPQGSHQDECSISWQTNPAPVAAEGIHCIAGRDAAGEL